MHSNLLDVTVLTDTKKGGYMDKKELERALNRVACCRNEVRRAKADIAFWSKELGAAVQSLTGQVELNFDIGKYVESVS